MSNSSSKHSQFRQSDTQTRFPDYEDVVELGRGGMGVVYRARHKSNGHYVVIKTMLKSSDERQTQRFQREASVLAELKHHNIVSIKSMGQGSGEFYFAMEYVEGLNLRSIVLESLRRQGQVPDIEGSLKIIRAIADGLALCHRKGIVHRDVKPENIVIGEDRPVLVDFGLVKHLDSQMDTTVQNLTKTGQMLGTPGFMPPEQLEFNGEYGQIGPASDVWSLGATLYFCLCGQQPFGALPFSAWCMAVADRNPPAVKTLNPDVPQWLSDLCSDCLERQTKLRPSMREVCERLEERKPSKSSNSRRVPILALCFFVLATGLGMLFVALNSHPPVIYLKTKRVLVSQSLNNPILIIGLVEGFATSVRVDGKKFEVGRYGRFKIRLRNLKEGKHTLTLVAEDPLGNQSLPIFLEAIVDRTPPQFKVEEVTLKDESLIVRGTVSETLKSFTVNKQPVTQKDSRFEVTLPSSELTEELDFELLDRVGLKTQRSPERLFVVSGKSRAKSLAKAIQNAPAGATIVLPKGIYRSHYEINKKLTVLGLGGERHVLIRADMPLRIVNGAEVSFEGLSLECKRVRSQATLFITEGSRVTMTRCRLRTEGQRGIHLQGSNSRQEVPKLTIQETVIERSIGPSLIANRGKIWAKDCIFKDPGPSLKLNGDSFQASVELRTGSEGRFEKCQFNDSLDRGVLVKSSRGEFIRCDFLRNMCEGALLRREARGIFRECRFKQNGYSGVLIEKLSSVDFYNCEFIRNGNDGVDPQRINGLRVFGRSKVQLVETKILDHKNKGLVTRESKINIYNCQFERNGGGNISQADSVITRKAPNQ